MIDKLAVELKSLLNLAEKLLLCTSQVVKHILIECPPLTSTRNKHFTASSMKDLFDNVATQNMGNFIKESHFYSTVCCYHIFYISSKP